MDILWKITTDDHVLIYSVHKTAHENGVGILLTKQVDKKTPDNDQ